jgi:hypothetical protein
MLQFKVKRTDRLLDSLPTEPSLDEQIDTALKNDPHLVDGKPKPKRPKLRVVK